MIPRWAWIYPVLLSVLLLGGAGYGSYVLFTMRLDARFEKHCRALREARQWRELNEVSRQWVEARPSNMRAIFFAAQSSEKLSDHEAAVKHLLSAPRDQPLSVIALSEAAEIQFSVLNQPLEAEKNFLEAIRRDPKEPQARQRLIFFYAMTMQRQKMIDHIHEAIKLGLETRENYVYLVGAEWLIFSNGPQYNNLWRKSDVENEHFNIARALGVVANGYMTPPENDQLMGQSAPLLRLAGTGIDSGIPEDRQGREAHYDEVLSAYLNKYPNNLEIYSFFLSRTTAAGDLAETGKLLAKLPPAAQNDSRFWRYKASWQLMKSKRAVKKEDQQSGIRDAEISLAKAIELNPYDFTSRHTLAGILRERGEMERVDRLEEIYNEGAEIRRLVLTAPTAHIDADLFLRIKNYVALCGQSDIADAMAKRLELPPVEDFFPSSLGAPLSAE